MCFAFVVFSMAEKWFYTLLIFFCTFCLCCLFTTVVVVDSSYALTFEGAILKEALQRLALVREVYWHAYSTNKREIFTHFLHLRELLHSLGKCEMCIILVFLLAETTAIRFSSSTLGLCSVGFITLLLVLSCFRWMFGQTHKQFRSDTVKTYSFH